MNEAINAVPAAPDTSYFPNLQQREDVGKTAAAARDAVLAAETTGGVRVCVGPCVASVVDRQLGAAQHALWTAAAKLNLAGLGQSALYRDIEASARAAEALQARLAVQMYV